jgi:hypothetical protein
MAVLNAQDRSDMASDLMVFASRDTESNGFLKDDMTQLVASIDSFLDTNAAAINNAIPAAVRNKFTTSQKFRALAFIARRRAGLPRRQD